MVSCGRTGGKPASESNSSVTIQADTFENDLDEGQRDMISDFMSALKGGDKRAIAGYFKYPFKLVPPLPAINDAEEMVEKYDLVLDDSIIESILSGRWGYFGWRGFSCGNGSILWADYDDSLRVYQICEKTSEQIKARDKAIEEQKQALHSSVRQFDVPEILAYAEEGTIRVDSVGDEYRLAFWGKGKPK